MDLRRIADLRNKSYKQNISLRFDKSLKRRRDKSDFLPQLLNHSSKNANRWCDAEGKKSRLRF